MCLAIPCKVIQIINHEEAVVENKGIKIKISSLLFPEVKIEDYVLIHAGFIIEKISKDDAALKLESFTQWKKIYDIE